MNKLKQHVMIFSSLLLLTGISNANAAVAVFEFERIEGSTLFYKNTSTQPAESKSLKTDISDLNHIGTLGDYILVSGKNPAIPQDKMVFALRLPSGKQQAFVYPGKIVDPKTRGLVFEGRAFWGQCLFGKGDVYVVYQREYIDKRRRMQSSVFVAEPSASNDTPYLSEKLIEKGLPRIQDTLKRVKAKKCFEIAGRNRMVLARPLDLSVRNDPDKDDKDDDEDDGKDNEKESKDDNVKNNKKDNP